MKWKNIYAASVKVQRRDGAGNYQEYAAQAQGTAAPAYVMQEYDGLHKKFMAKLNEQLGEVVDEPSGTVRREDRGQPHVDRLELQMELEAAQEASRRAEPRPPGERKT